jgi:hypothetical protein
MAEFYQIIQEELISTLLKAFQEVEGKEHYQIHFMKPYTHSKNQ